MEILEAYCVELDRSVDIYEAQQTFFAMPVGRRQRFNFLCSDDACRASRTPPVMVVGVNYDKHAEETEKYRQPYFKSHVKHPHSNACLWVMSSRAKVKQEGEDEKLLSPREEKAKATDIIDAFSPKAFDTPARLRELPQTTKEKEPDEDSDEETTGSKSRLREGFSTTSKLERFIDCWSQYDGDARRGLHVVIEDRKLTYRQAVLHVSHITPEESGRRIVFGGVRARLWPESNPKRLYLNFMDDCNRFNDHDGGKSLTIDLPIRRVSSYLGGPLLMTKIEDFDPAQFYLTAYAWGPIEPRAGKQGYELKLDALDNLVLKVVKKKRGG